MTLQPIQVDQQNQNEDERLLKEIDDQRRAYNLTWDVYCGHLGIAKKTIFRWMKEKKIGKTYRKVLNHLLDENEKRLISLRRSNLLETRKRKSVLL